MQHPFFDGINWETLIKDPVPWYPGNTKEPKYENFPKATDEGLNSLYQEEIKEANLVFPCANMKHMSMPWSPDLILPDAGKTQTSQQKINGPDQANSSFQKFDGISYPALTRITENEAEKELRRIDRIKAKMEAKGQPFKQKDRFANQESLMSSTHRDLPAMILLMEAEEEASKTLKAEDLLNNLVQEQRA